MKSLVLLALLVAVASAAYTRYGHRTYHGVSPYYSGYRYHGYPARYYGPYSHLYRHRREAEAEPQPEAEAEADPGSYVYNTVPYVTPHHVPYYTVNPAAVKVKTAATVPVTYTYPQYLPYAGAYGHYGFNPYAINPYHYPYVVKPVENEADEPTAATSEDDSETVEVSRKRREAEAEAEAEADPATKVVTHHVAPYPYSYLSPYTAVVAPKVLKTYVAPKVVKTYTAAAHTYPTYPYYSGYYGYPGYLHG